METEESRFRRAIFFDRDGVINMRVVGDYIRRPEDLRILPDLGPALRTAHQLGFLAVVVTNQRGIALGRMTSETVDQIHAELQRSLHEEWKDQFDAIYVCPHNNDQGCACRKPAPGMLLQAAREIGIDLSRSWMIGDSASDIEAGLRAGCSTAYIVTGSGSVGADVVAHSLEGAILEIAAEKSTET